MLRLTIVVCVALAAAGAALMAGAEKPEAPARTGAIEAQLKAAPPFVPLAPAAAPVPWPSSTLVPAPKGSWLPPAEVRTEPRAVAASGPPAPRARRAADLPPLADVSGPPAPASRQLDAGPPAAAPAPDINVLPILPLRLWYQLDRYAPLADPTRGPSREAAVAAEPPFRQSLAPFVRLSIPDPFEFLNEIRLLRPPADSEPPVTLKSRAPKPVLPTKP